MKAFIMSLMMVSLVSVAHAHEMTPTYPKLEPSHLDGVVKTTMQMFNKEKKLNIMKLEYLMKNLNQYHLSHRIRLLK